MRNFTRILLFSLSALIIFSPTKLKAQCAGGNNNGAVSFLCNVQASVNPQNQGDYRQFAVIAGVSYNFNTSGNSFDSRIYGNQNGVGGANQFNQDIDNVAGNNESIDWTATFSGTLGVAVHFWQCGTWNGASAVLNYRQNTTITNTTSSADICNGGTKSLTYVLGGPHNNPTPTWSIVGGTGAGTIAGSTFTATSPGTIVVRATLGVCSSDVSFTVLSQSVAPTIIGITSGTNPTCPGVPVTLQVSNGTLGSGASWQWYSGSCGGTFVGSGASINVAPITTTTYFVRAVGTCNLSGTACASITVNVLSESSVASASATPTTICVGQSSILSVTGTLGTGATWNWYTGSCGGTLVGQGVSISVNPTSSTTYYVRAIGTCNATSCTSTSVSVNPLPGVSFASPGGPYCANQTTPVSLSAAPSGGTFSGNGVIGSTFTPANAAVGNNTLTYTYTDGNGCTNSAQQNVTVTGLPLVTFTGLAGPYCVSQTTPVALDGNQNGGTYSGPGITNLGSGNASFNPSTAGAGVHSITYSYTDGNGCVNSQTQSVQVIALPLVSISGLASSYCVSNSPVQLTGFPAGGTFSGTGVTTGGLFSPSTGVGNYTITYSYTNGNGCTNSTQASTVVNALPTVSFSGFSGSSYCLNAAVVNLTGNPVGGTFSGPGVTGSGAFTPATAGLGTHTIVYTFTNGNGCTNTSSQAVTVVSVPTVTFSGLAGDYCVNDFPVLLTGNQSGGTFSGPGITNQGPGIAQFSPTQAGIGGSYDITYSYSDGNGCSGSQTQQTVVHPQPVVDFSGLDAAYCVDASVVTLTGSHAPDGTFSGTGVTDNSDGTATFDAALAGVGGPYTITYSFTDVFGCSSSISETTLVNDTPTVNFTGYMDLCIDQPPLVLTGTPSGGIFTGNGISGNAFYPAVAGLGDHLVTYTYNDGNGCEGLFSAIIRVYDIPQVTQQPQDIQVCPGDNAVFTVAAVGLGLTYQWQLNDGNGFVNVNNGGIYSGATSPSLTLNGVPPSLDGYQFNCVITGATCFTTTTSSTVTITENPSPTINTQPVDYAACVGDNAVFSVSASGTGLTYQWQVNTGGGFVGIFNGGVYSGATTNTLNITGFTSGMDGYQYRCIVTGTVNCTSNTISNYATLTETTSPNVITQPVSQNICEGDNAVFIAAATGSGLTYQWQEDSGSGFANITNGGAYSGATSATLTVSGVTAGMNGNQYQCIISGSICVNSSTTNAVALNITTSPYLSQQPVDVYVCPSDPASFSVSVQGTGITYQWQVNNGSGFTNIINGGVYSGATTSTLNISGVFTNMDGFQYQCVVSGTFCSGTSTSQVATIYLNGAPVITLDPSDTQYCEGDNATFVVNANGTGLSYQWQVNNGSGWVDLVNGFNYSGVNSSTLSLSGIPLSFDGNQYQVIVSGTINCSGTSTSAVATLTENPAPFISSQPVDAFICDGGNAVFNVTANGTGLTYQWQENTGGGFADIVDGGQYSGANTASLTISGVNSGMDGYQYQVLINGTICTATATSVTVTLNSSTAPVVTAQPADVQVCPGDAASFSVSASGSNLSYQWEEDSGSGFNALSDGGIYSGTNSATLNLASTTLGMNGNQYRVIVSSTDCPNTTFSNIVVLNINTSPVIVSDPTDVYVCQLDPVSFSVTASGTGLTYQWQENTGSGFVDVVDNIIYSGSNTPTLNIVGAGPWMLGYQYRVVVSGTINCSSDAISNYAVLYINTSPLVATQPTDQNYCEGDIASFSVTANGSFLTYQWQVNDGNGFVDVTDGGVYSGATTATLSLSGIPLSYDGYQYQVVISGSNNCSSTVTSAVVTLNEDPNPFISSQPVDQYVCLGDIAVFDVTASGTGLTYQWQEDSGGGFVILSDGGIYSGSSTSTLTLNGTLPGMDGYTYRCVINGVICSGTSVTNVVTLNETASPYISVQPQDQSVCDGDNVTLGVTANGTGLTYQWQVNTGSGFVNVTNGSLYSGATTSTLNISTTTLAMDGYQYQVTINGTICTNASTSNTVTLNVGTGPNITLGPANQVICDGDNASFTVTTQGTGLTYQWQVNDGGGWNYVISGGVYSNTNTPTLVITGADVSMNGYQYQCIVAGSINCSVYSTSTSAVLLVNPLPVVNFSGLNSEYCLDAPLATLTGVPSGGTFSGPGIIGNDFSASTAGVGGPYTILYEYTDGNGCYNSTTQTVSVNPLPVVSFTGLAGPYCINDNTPVQLTGAPAGGTFSGPGINGDEFTPSNASLGTVSITYTYTDGNGCTNFETQTAIVNDIPALTLSGTAPSYCVDDNTPVTLVGTPAGGTFSGAGVTGGTWTASDAGVGTHTITYTYTDGNNCTNSTTISVVVNDLPVVTFTGLAANYCVDAPADALTGIPASGLFSGTGINVNDFDPAIAGVGTHDITYTYTDVNGCVNSETQSTTVNALPTPVITPSTVAFCEGDYAILDGGAGYVDYDWTTGFNGQQTLVDASGQVTVTVTDINGCVGTSSPATVVVNALPVVDLGPDTTICTQTTYTLNAGYPGSTYDWSTGEITQQITVGTSGVYAVTVVDQNGCEGFDYAIVTVSQLLTPTITSSGNPTFCEGDSIVLTATSGYTTYLWSSGQTTESITVTTAGFYQVFVTNSLGCDGFSAPLIVTTLTNPSPAISADGPLSFCPGEDVVLNAGFGYSAFEWQPGLEHTQTLTVTTPGDYSVTVTGSNGCSGTSPVVTVEVFPVPNPQIQADGPLQFCDGEDVVLSVLGNYASYLWTSGSTTPTILVTESGQYGVIVMDMNGCVDSSQVVNPVTVTVWDPQPFIVESGDTLTCTPAFATYQWYENDTMVTVPGFNQQILITQSSGNYTVVVTDANGCTGESNIIEHSQTSIHDVTLNAMIDIYPNPTNSVFTFNAQFEGYENLRLELTNTLGQLIIPVEDVKDVMTVKRDYNLNHLPDGMYMLTVRTEKGSVTKRIIKN
ncbi:MAG: hypothetical protein POELPBGB_03301 [Bacteroidia bacterium]|nr:hypothetical protein [Bacteroidia bacterium]